MKSKEATLTKHIPTSKHYQIIVFETRTISHEGDERSRTNPGHGYPEYTETISIPRIYVTTNKEDWEGDIKELYSQKPTRTDVVACIIQGVAKLQLSLNIS